MQQSLADVFTPASEWLRRQVPCAMQALTAGGQALQTYLQGRPEMRAYIPVLLQQMNIKK